MTKSIERYDIAVADGCPGLAVCEGRRKAGCIKMQLTSNKKVIDMTQGAPIKLIIFFAFPLLIGNILQQVYNMTDTLVVGRFAENGTRCIAAVGAAAPVMFLLFSLFMGVGQGASVVISQYCGAKDRDSLQRAVDTIYIALFVCAIPVTLLGLALSRPLLEAMKVPPETMELSLLYLRIVLIGLFSTFGYNINAGILQGTGDSRSPVLFLAISVTFDIFLNLLFVIVFRWDVMGVALSTVMAQTVSFIFGVVHINRIDAGIKIRLMGIRFDAGILRECIRIGLPAGLQNMLFSVGTMFLQGLINRSGEEFMAGFTTAQKIDSMAFMPIMSFSAAITTFVGQNIGAGKYDRVKTGVRSATLISILACAFITLLVLPVSGLLLGLFNDSADVIKYGQEYLVRVMPFFVFLAVLFIHNSALRGAGVSVIPLISSILSLWAIRVPTAYLMDWLFGGSNIYFSFGIGWLVGAAFSVTYYNVSGWLSKLEMARGKAPGVPLPDGAPCAEAETQMDNMY